MPGLFRCTQCNHVDHMDIVYPNGAEMDDQNLPMPLRCTVCHDRPWHNRLDYEAYNPEVHDVVNPPPTEGVIMVVD